MMLTLVNGIHLQLFNIGKTNLKLQYLVIAISQYVADQQCNSGQVVKIRIKEYADD